MVGELTGEMETILVVDDESLYLKLAAETLASAGYRVLSADNAELALALVAQSPDLILVDFRTSALDPTELGRRLKTLKGSTSTPLILMSAGTDADAFAPDLTPGVVDFLSKPFHQQQLLTRIQTHLELRRLREHLEVQVARRTAQLNADLRRLERDIADRTRTEQAQIESEEGFRNLANTLPALIWFAGPHKLCTFFNQSWLNFTGRTLNQELGNGWVENVHPDDLVRCLSTFLTSLDTPRPFKMQYRLRRSDGEYRWILGEAAPRYQPGGGFHGYVGSCMDVTDFRKAQQPDLLRTQVDSLQLLACGVAHDFTNLMGSILAAAELAESEIADSSSPIEEIQAIKTVTGRAIEMARELMTCAGEVKVQVELLNLAHLVEEMAVILKSSISKRVTLQSYLPKDLPFVRGNPTHIRQLVMNLIINASEAIGDASGTIDVRISRASDQQSSDSGRANMLPVGDYLRLKVSDTGCGMTNEQRARMFDPFFTTKHRGNGLGLAVVNSVVHAHGGLINVTSAPGRGTMFEIFFPCVEEQFMKRASSAR